MKRRRRLSLALGLLLMACERPRAGAGVDRAAARAPSASSAVTASASAPPEEDALVLLAPHVVVPDEELVDQDGAPVRLRALLAGRVVAVNFVFTTCTSICSPMTAVFSRLQGELGPALERDARLVSISLDPATDTPERLRAYADRFGRQKGWTFLTGDAARLTRVRRALLGEAGAKEGHRAMTLVGSAAGGRWAQVVGVASTRRLSDEMRGFLPGPRAASQRGGDGR